MPYVFATPPQLEENSYKWVKDSTEFHFSVTLVTASPLPKLYSSLQASSCSPERAPGAGQAAACFPAGCQCLPLQALLEESLEKAQEESERIERAIQELEERMHSIKVAPRPPRCWAGRWECAGSHSSSLPRTHPRGSNR